MWFNRKERILFLNYICSHSHQVTQNEFTLAFRDHPSPNKSAYSRLHAKFDRTGSVFDAKHDRVSTSDITTEKVEEVAILFEEALQTSLCKAQQIVGVSYRLCTPSIT